jgi:hypothetical protein
VAKLINRLEDLIAARHADPGRWSVFFEVRPNTGFSGGRFDRRLDAVAIGHWPSDGLERIAYEIKVARSDFLREIKDAKKREFAVADFHRCFFVCDPGVVKEPSREIPEGWGLLVRTKKGDKLRTVLQAKPREAGDMPPGLAHVLLRDAAQRLERFAAAKYRLDDGQEVSDEQIREIVAECVSAERTALGLLRGKLEERSKRIEADRRAMAEPLERLAELAGLRRRHLRGWGDDQPLQAVSVADVNRWADDARAKLLRDVVAPLEHTRDMIDRTLAAVATAAAADAEEERAE